MKMTWHETILYIRTKSEYEVLVEKAYLEENLPLNVNRFRKSEEFSATLSLLKHYAPKASSILDVGSGNGVSAISFALKGYNVVAIEPDPSDTIGAGAIKKLKEYYGLKNIEVEELFAEDLNIEKEQFDIVYARQSMHHANELNGFVREAVRGLKKGGLFISVRDHVLYNHQKDRDWFLEAHPLHKFYGGENAFTEEEYRKAIESAGLSLKKVLRYYDSVVNYSPMSRKRYIFRFVAKKLLGLFLNEVHIFDESKVPGRMYTFIAIKN